jgi:hypothetical protein
VLIGDAAHAMTPFAAQGAAMAIEDAALLGKPSRRTSDTAQALRQFETTRRERVARVRSRGAFNRFAYHARGPIALSPQPRPVAARPEEPRRRSRLALRLPHTELNGAGNLPLLLQTTGRAAPSPRAVNSPRRRQATLDVRLDVLHVLEPNLEAQHRAFLRPLGDAAVAETDVHRKALEATPGIAEAENAERIEEGMRLRLVALRRTALQDDGEDAARRP